MRITIRATRLSAGLVAAGLALAIAATAHAAGTTTFTFLGSSAPGVIGQNVSISKNGGGSYSASYAGRYRGKFTGSAAFNIFCVDVMHNINWGDSYTTLVVLGRTTAPAQPLDLGSGFYESATDVPGGLASAMNTSDYWTPGNYTAPGLTAAQRASAVAYLGSQYLSAALTNVQAAAIQLAIWDLVQDGGDGISAGAFRATGIAVATVQTYINQGLANTSFVSGDITDYIQARRVGSAGNHKQEFIYELIPEPVFFQMGALVGLGAAAMLRSRRKTS